MNAKFLYIILFLLPVTCVSFFLKETDFQMEEKQEQNVFVEKNEDILEVDLEEYLIGVLAGEMPALFEVEALKAQAIASRTYYLYHNAFSNSIKGTTDNQVYLTKEEMQAKWEEDYERYYTKLKEAVISTDNEVITYEGNLIKSYYYSSSNGYSESSLNVFNESQEYLVVNKSPFEEIKETETTFSTTNFCEILSISCNTIEVKNIEYDESNRVKQLWINDKVFTGISIRKLLNLRSTDFQIEVKNDIIIKTKGYGHGVGMSQYGANEMAKRGYNYKEILQYYYQNTEITKL